MRIGIFAVLLSATVLAQATPSLTFRGQSRRPLHATVTAGPADLGVKSGVRTMLFIDVTPNPNIHVYAPGAKDYIPITVKLEPQVNVKLGKVTYPKAEIMTLLDEKVPVFHQPFRLMQEVSVIGSTLKPGDTVAVKGTVEWQACDDKVCYPPESAPVSWTLTLR
jgi:hypothetical protein